MPLISVIVPVYKVEKYLKKCVDSILSQTLQDFEVFLIDDGSPDNCGKICDEYSEKDNRIIVIHKKNGGLSDARNVALNKISGEYITFIDSDDYVSQNHLETLYNALVNSESDMSVCNISSYSDNQYDDSFFKPSNCFKVLDDRKSIFNPAIPPCACAKLFKKTIFNDIRFPVGRLYEDIFVNHEVLAKAKRLALTGENTYYYLIRSDSIMHQEYKPAFTDIIDALNLRIKKLEELKLYDLADENRRFIYSRVSVAFANLDASVPENRKRLNEIKKIYEDEYPKLMKATNNSKQKFRYWLLRYCPGVHSKLFGKKMSLALG